MTEAAVSNQTERALRLQPEAVAYWYLRLNGFLQIENFVVHPKLYGGQRTDADLIGVRFPHRAERLIDDPDDLMEDDRDVLNLSGEKIDVIIAEIKTSRCALNGPWTDEERQNIHRVLAAIGCLPPDRIEAAAAALYGNALYESPAGLRIRLVLIGRDVDPGLTERYTGITQVTWSEAASFIWRRFDRYRRQKAQVDQWDNTGRILKEMARRNSVAHFVAAVCDCMGVLKVNPDKAL